MGKKWTKSIRMWCRGGWFLNTFKKNIPTIEAVGIELLSDACLDAYKLCLSNENPASLINSDTLKMPFKDKVFDLTYAIGLLEHFEDPSNLIEERKRITKKGGIILDLVPNCIITRKPIRKVENILIHRFKGYEKEYDYKSLIKLYQKGDLYDIELDGIQLIFPYPINALIRPLELMKSKVNLYGCRHLVIKGTV